MTPNTTDSAKIFAVIQFLERPHRDIAKHVCVPTSWITQRLPNCRAAVPYPREDTNSTKIRVENNELPVASWPVFMAIIKYETDDYDDADVWITMEENMSADIIDLDDDEDDSEALVYISESDDNMDCGKTDILGSKQDKPKDIDIPKNVDESGKQEDDADISIINQDKPSELEDGDMSDNVNSAKNQEDEEVLILKTDASYKSENIDSVVSVDDSGDQDDSDIMILNEDRSKEKSSKSNNNSVVNNFVNNGAGSVLAGDISIKSENNIIYVENNNVDTLTSMEEKTSESEFIVINDDEDDLDDLKDVIILEKNKSDTIAVDSRDDNIDDSIKDTEINHVEYSTQSLNIQTTEKSLVETNVTPSTPSAEAPHHPTISVVPEHVLRYGCHEQKLISENTTQGEVNNQNTLARQDAIKIVKSLSITKAQVRDNINTSNISGNFPHGEARSSNILRPNDGQKTYDQNTKNIFVESGNVSNSVEYYNNVQYNRHQINAPIANSKVKPKKTVPAKKMKSKASTKKVLGYNQTQYHEQRGYTYYAPQQGDQVKNTSYENITSHALYFQQNSCNQLYQKNVQQLAAPAEHLPVYNNMGNNSIKTTTRRIPLILNAPQSNRNTIPKSAPHISTYHPSTVNRFSHEVGPNENELQNYTGRKKQTYPAEAVYVHHIPNQQGTLQKDPSVMANYYYNPSYSNSVALSANQFAPDNRNYSVIQNPHNHNQLPLTQNRYQTVPPAMPSTVTSANVSHHFPNQLRISRDAPLPSRQIQQNFQMGSKVMNQQRCDIQSIQQNALGNPMQSSLHCSSLHGGQFASATFSSNANTKNSTVYDAQCSELNPNPHNSTVINVSAVQNQPNEIREEQDSIDQMNTDIRNSTAYYQKCSELNPDPDNTTVYNVSAEQNQPNETREEQDSIDQMNTGCEQPAPGMVVANETDSRLSTADRQEPAEETSQVCSTGEKIEGDAKDNHNSSNVTNELTAAIKQFELIFSQAEKSIRKQTEAYKVRHNKMFECDNEFDKVIEAVIGHCESRMNMILKSKSKNASKRTSK